MMTDGESAPRNVTEVERCLRLKSNKNMGNPGEVTYTHGDIIAGMFQKHTRNVGTDKYTNVLQNLAAYS
jgi:hypothetical protein